MLNSTVERVAKNSILYSYMLSQPFALYVDAYPVLQNNLLIEAEQLQYSENGETVRVLQYKLNKLSYYDDEIDGEFGLLTEHALKKFQGENNILVTGQTDIDTITAIINMEKNKYMEQVKELSESIYVGMHSNDVKIVQEALFYFGYYKGSIDGIYGPLTKQALEMAEDIHEIELINEINQETLIQLYETEETKQVIERNNEAKQVTESNNEIKKIEKEKSEASTPKEVNVQNTNNSNVVQVAQSFIGTPYLWGGQSPGGFDCSGFINYVFQAQGITIPRTVTDIWNFSQSVTTQSVGDFVFFETYKAGPSHMGIYIGDGKFIHAGESRGVEVTELSNPYWQEKYLGAKRIK